MPCSCRVRGSVVRSLLSRFINVWRRILEVNTNEPTAETWYRMADYPVKWEFDYPTEQWATMSLTDKYILEVPMVKRTRCGCWVQDGRKRHFILEGARKQWASPTKEKALEAWIARKRRQVMILHEDLGRVQGLLKEVTGEMYEPWKELDFSLQGAWGEP